MTFFLYKFTHPPSTNAHPAPQTPSTILNFQICIQAKRYEDALTWGHQVLADFLRQAASHGLHISNHSGSKGEIIAQSEFPITGDQQQAIPLCKIGQYPRWTSPAQSTTAVGTVNMNELENPDAGLIYITRCPTCQNFGLERIHLVIGEMNQTAAGPKSFSTTIARCLSCSAQAIQRTTVNKGRWKPHTKKT